MQDAVVFAELETAVQAIGAQNTYSIYGNLWNLDRIDQRTLPLDNAYNYASDGSGVHVYVIDTVCCSHQCTQE